MRGKGKEYIKKKEKENKRRKRRKGNAPSVPRSSVVVASDKGRRMSSKYKTRPRFRGVLHGNASYAFLINVAATRVSPSSPVTQIHFSVLAVTIIERDSPLDRVNVMHCVRFFIYLSRTSSIMQISQNIVSYKCSLFTRTRGDGSFRVYFCPSTILKIYLTCKCYANHTV